jgi:bifunctional DNase/RNase
MRMVSVPRKETVMRTVTDTGLVEMRFGKVVGVATAEGDACCCVVLEAVSGDCQLPIQIGDTEAFNLAATLTGEEFARPMSPQFAAGLLSALGGQVRQVRIDRLIPAFGGGIAYAATVEVDGASGVELVDSRPSDALNLLLSCQPRSSQPRRSWLMRKPGWRVIPQRQSFCAGRLRVSR